MSDNDMAQRLRIIEPPPALSPWVSQIWQAEGQTGWRDRCYADARFGLHIELDSDHAVVEAAGQGTRLTAVEPGQGLVGVRFRFGGAQSLYGADAQRSPALSVLNRGFVAVHRAMRDQPRHALEILTDWLTAQAGQVHRPSERLQDAAMLLSTGDRPPPMEAVAEQVGYSVRHLQRVFRGQLGLSPLTVAQIHRARRARHLIADAPERPLADIAFELDFADQAQFSKAFKRYCGVSPGAYRRRKLTSEL